MKRKMKRRRTSTAALLAFTAHLLDHVDLSSASSTTLGSGTRRPTKSLLNQRPSTTAFSLQQRGRSHTAFVHQESAGGVIRKRSSGHRDNGSPPPSSSSSSSHHQSSSQHYTRSPSSTITSSRTSPIQIWKQRNVSAHLTKNRIDDVTPRYYVSSSSSSSSS